MIKTSLLVIKSKVNKFYNILNEEYKCATHGNYGKFITKNLRYSKRGIGSYYPNKRLNGILERCGFEYLGSGASRFVLGYGKFAIKIERYNECLDGGDEPDEVRFSPNTDELWAYNEIKQEPLRKLLIVPILSHFKIKGNLILIFPRLTSYEELFSDPSKSHLLDNPYNKLKEAACNWLFTDTSTENFGLYKNELFFLDYNIESDDPSNVVEVANIDTMQLLKTPVDDFKMQKENIHRTKQYIKEMKCLI